MNDLDLCLEVVSRSRQPLRYIRCWISRRPLEIEAWFQRTTNRKLHMGYQMVTWPMTSRDTQRCCQTVHPAILATAWLLVRRVFWTVEVCCSVVVWTLTRIHCVYFCSLTSTLCGRNSMTLWCVCTLSGKPIETSHSCRALPSPCLWHCFTGRPLATPVT